jgi:hypothetical protein
LHEYKKSLDNAQPGRNFNKKKKRGMEAERGVEAEPN